MEYILIHLETQKAFSHSTSCYKLYTVIQYSFILYLIIYLQLYNDYASCWEYEHIYDFLPFQNSSPSGEEIEVDILLWLRFLEYFGSKVLTKLMS